jgi:PIN domain nuclease of toxin-antitoxin system
MRLLLDTNVFIWLNDSPQRINEKVMSILANPDNDLFLSLTSIWENSQTFESAESPFFLNVKREGVVL